MISKWYAAATVTWQQTSNKNSLQRLHYASFAPGKQITQTRRVAVYLGTYCKQITLIITLTVASFIQITIQRQFIATKRLHLLHNLPQKNKNHTARLGTTMWWCSVFTHMVLSTPRNPCHNPHVRDPTALSVCFHNTYNIITKQTYTHVTWQYSTHLQSLNRCIYTSTLANNQAASHSVTATHRVAWSVCLSVATHRVAWSVCLSVCWYTQSSVVCVSVCLLLHTE